MWTADVTPSSNCSRHRNWHRGENVIDLFSIKIIRLHSAGSKPANIFNKTKWFRITPLLSRFKFQTYKWWKNLFSNEMTILPESPLFALNSPYSFMWILNCEMSLVSGAQPVIPPPSIAKFVHKIWFQFSRLAISMHFRRPSVLWTFFCCPCLSWTDEMHSIVYSVGHWNFSLSKHFGRIYEICIYIYIQYCRYICKTVGIFRFA